jgi:geranylgeranyl diphosphate synthase type I
LEHPARDELVLLVKENQVATNAERVREILDTIDTRSFMIWAALKERNQALEAISICPNTEGKQLLISYQYVRQLCGKIMRLWSSYAPKTG